MNRPLTIGERIFWVAVLAATLLVCAIPSDLDAPATDPKGHSYREQSYRNR